MSDTFGSVEFVQQEVNEDEEGVFKRVDPAPYISFIADLANKPKGTEARIRVATGEIITKGKSSKGRGKSELADARAFQAAASQMGHGLRTGWRHNADGTTVLRMMIQKKRVFSEETTRKRNVALDKRRLQFAEAKLSAAPGSKELQAKVKEIRDRIAANGTNPAPKTAAKQ